MRAPLTCWVPCGGGGVPAQPGPALSLISSHFWPEEGGGRWRIGDEWPPACYCPRGAPVAMGARWGPRLRAPKYELHDPAAATTPRDPRDAETSVDSLCRSMGLKMEQLNE
ncbi:hypothetical protein E2562_036810 [Oryza meyeriana var. granulata]|uniref:Uncharacterized protein n=1 Tax=Oryza meyeriana var. granulata TaxID=110450 RepID=A0A6G1ET98_9ORYZ|nr:hypothetical protein E2562_036810 [Oryza meyeriana var. granulata]